MKVTLVSPRNELSQITTELSRFDMFHVIREGNSQSDSNLNDLALRAFKILINMEEIHKELGIKEIGIIDTLTKGNKIEKEKFKAKDWKDFIEKLETDANPLINDLQSLLSEKSNLQNQIVENKSLKKAFSMLADLSVDLDILRSLKQFHVFFSVFSTKDLIEVRNSLSDDVFISVKLTPERSALFITTPTTEYDRVEKILRSFEIKPFEIPERLPQNLIEAQNIVNQDLDKQIIRLNEITSAIITKVEKSTQKMLSIREGAQTVHEVFTGVKKAGDLQHFAVVSGYVPKKNIIDFKKKISKWITLIEDVKHEEEKEENSPNEPTLMKNFPFIRAFEPITLNKGPPKYSDVDPTPFIMLTFPVFYGIMFGDLGHGIILSLFGILLYIRGNNPTKKWGVMLTVSGITASIVGFSIGEVFGFAIGDIIPSLQHPLLEIVERHHGVTSFNKEAVTTILQISIILGIFHLTLGFGLDVFKTIREKEYVEAFVDKIPTFIMYIFGVIFALAFLGAGNNFDGLLTMQNPIPLLGIPVAQATLISLPIFVIATIILIFGKPVAIILKKAPKESLAMSLVMGLVEFIIRIVEFLANTMSYARLGVLLLVHAALLMVLNRAVSLPIFVAIPMLIIFNVLVMMLEGLIVYIQDIRLHLYEWFTKFYEGTGFIFQKMKPEPTYFDLEWEEK
jgi:V/A-type H+-transporting ATPase subunit I|tara:strand:- start:2721 stop:4760 length:2040 start_codon:yes stop_codon:yes gene_type:complete